MTDNIRGILLKVTAVSIFTVMMALIKATSAEVPTGQQVFFRAFFSLLVVIGWLTARGGGALWELGRCLYDFSRLGF